MLARGAPHRLRRGKAFEPQIADDIRNAAVAEHRTGRAAQPRVAVKVVRQYGLGKSQRIDPGQGTATLGLLLLDDAPPRLGRGGEARMRQGPDQRGLARAGTAGQHKKFRGGHREDS